MKKENDTRRKSFQSYNLAVDWKDCGHANGTINCKSWIILSKQNANSNVRTTLQCRNSKRQLKALEAEEESAS